MRSCRVCGGALLEFLDLGQQPIANAFLEPGQDGADEFFFRLAVARCDACAMVQLLEEVPRERMFHQDYPYYSSGSSVMRKHFELTGRRFLETELTGPDPFLVELGSNDGIMLKVIAAAGVRHLGVEPSGGVAEQSRSAGVRVRNAFFEEGTAREIAESEGRADVVFSANTVSHIPYLDSVFRGLDALLKPDGVFVFEDPYLGDIVARTSFDQIYDEHFFLFSAQSVRATAERFGFELVDARRIPVHGGEVRFTVARAGRRAPTKAVADLLAEEERTELSAAATLRRFADNVATSRRDLRDLLCRLRDEGKTVVGYGATAKSATITNYCDIGPDLISFVCDTTPAKQGKLTPGAHIPVRPPEAFASPYPDYAVLFAWNHADEIIAKEQPYRQAGGQWITHVPSVHTL